MVDRVDRVIDGELRDRQCPRGVDRRGLGAGCLDELKQILVPLQNLIWLRGGGVRMVVLRVWLTRQADACERQSGNDGRERRESFHA